MLALREPMPPRPQEMPPVPEPGSLGVVAGVEGSLQDAGGEDDPVLGGQVVGVDGLRGHAPPGAGRWDRGQAGTCPLFPQPRHPPVPSPTTDVLCCSAWGWHCCPHPVTEGPRSCPGDKPEPPRVTYNTAPPHGGAFPPGTQCHPAHAVTPCQCHLLCPARSLPLTGRGWGVSGAGRPSLWQRSCRS